VRVESSVTTVSWIPSEAVEGLMKLPFEMGLGHYDDPPPDVLHDLAELHRRSAFRFANELRAWVEVEDGRIVDHGHAGRSWISFTQLRVGPLRFTLQPTGFPELRSVPHLAATAVTFEQTTGGRAGVPAPRTVEGRPFVQVAAPTVWTTLRLTINADGTSGGELVGASAFPRHWVYDDEGRLVAKSGLTDFQGWYTTAFGAHSPWGDENSPVLVTLAESALERQMAGPIMRGGAAPEVKRLPPGHLLTRQGDPGDELYLVLDGVLEVEVDGRRLAEIGPGAIVGERAVLEGGARTATVRALTDCWVAVARAGAGDTDALAELAAGHRREEA
jgi:hypothetical protein